MAQWRLWFPDEPGNRRLQGLGDPLTESLQRHSEESGLDRGGNMEAAPGAGLGGSEVMRVVPRLRVAVDWVGGMGKGDHSSWFLCPLSLAALWCSV